MTKIDVLDADMGIQSVLDAPEPRRLPEAQPLASTVLRPLGMEALYAPGNLRTLVASALHPAVGDGDVLRPGEFSARLRRCADALRGADDSALREAVEKELDPLLANEDLLHAYTGLMIGS